MLSRALVAALVLAAACAKLPEDGTPAAELYARRCGECHRAYQPGAMTWPMWEYQLGRMKTLFLQLRKPWLEPDEERMMVEYLERHALGRAKE
jgi:hypothetical protein